MNIRYLLAALLVTLLSGCLSEPPATGDKGKQQPPIERMLADDVMHEVTPATARPQKSRPFAPAGIARMASMAPSPYPLHVEEDRDNYAAITENGVQLAKEKPVSTLSVDVDSGSYATVRRHLNSGRLPPNNAVRVEELINYFGYDYPLPEQRNAPIRLYTEAAATPWNANTLLLHVGIQGYRPQTRPAANLVFLIDVSGSMHSANKLPLLKSSFKLLVNNLTAKDRVSLVTYAGNAGMVLEPTPGNQRHKILSALDRLDTGGSTHGSAGIHQAYALAEQSRIDNGINRIILATDGDFNVGTVSHDKLIELIEQKRQQGISLTTLGFGSGNYNDHLMEQLADKGNGNYGYIDTISEAQKILVDELASTLETIAADVKIQIEFNPDTVAEYRLIGYENRLLAREDFNNDKVDAGEIGAGHTVTALYEITLGETAKRRIDRLRYGKDKVQNNNGHSDELGYLKLRYKLPGHNESTLVEQPLKRSLITDEPSRRYRFSAAVAAFGQLLRGGKQLEKFGHNDIVEMALSSRGDDRYGYRSEFIRLVRLAASLKGT